MITVVENNSLHADVEIACIEEYHRILAGTLNAHKAHHLLSIKVNERTELTNQSSNVVVGKIILK